MRIAAVDDSAAERWNAFVARAPDATIYHRYEWRELIAATFGHASHYFAAYDAEGRVRGVLPLVRLRSKLFGDFMVSMPFFNYGGVLAQGEVAGELLQHAASHAREIGVSHL